MKTPCTGALALIAMLFAAAHAAEPKEFVIACPAAIETTQMLRHPTPPGWIQVADVPDHDSSKQWKNTHRLRGIRFSDGHPSNLATLAPENADEYGRGRKFVQRWSLFDSTDFYATCEYNQTTVELTHPIPAGYKVCEVRYEKQPSIELVGASCIK